MSFKINEAAETDSPASLATSARVGRLRESGINPSLSCSKSIRWAQALVRLAYNVIQLLPSRITLKHGNGVESTY
jgi:hypothetical protein